MYIPLIPNVEKAKELLEEHETPPLIAIKTDKPFPRFRISVSEAEGKFSEKIFRLTSLMYNGKHVYKLEKGSDV